MELKNFPRYLIIGREDQSSNIPLEQNTLVYNLEEDFYSMKLHIQVKRMMQYFLKTRKGC